MSDNTLCGTCACGSVAYEITPPFQFFQYCHCSRCRKRSGAAHAANILLNRDQFTWTQGEELVNRWEHPAAVRFCNAFCTVCGSKLPWATRSGESVLVPAGTLDDAPTVLPERNIFWKSKAAWYREVGTLPKFDESQVLAK